MRVTYARHSSAVSRDVAFDSAVRSAAWWLVICGMASLGQPSAHAQSAPGPEVLLLTPTRTESPESWTGIVRGLRLAGLRVAQVSVLPIDPIYAACSQPECAVNAAAAARMPALLSTYDTAQQTLEIQWYEGDGKHWSSRASLRAGVLANAATALGERLRRQRSLGDRALLRVESVPSGASVSLDGGSIEGVTPFERECSPGPHRVQVTLPGHAVAERTETLRSGALHDVHVELPRHLGRALAGTQTGELGQSHEPSDHAAPLNFVLGAVLGVAAAPLLIAASNSLVDDGQCLASDATGCTDRARVGAGDGLMLGLGIAALAGATYLFVAQPVRVDLDPRERAVSVHYQQSF